MNNITKLVLLGCGLVHAAADSSDKSFYAKQFDIDAIQKSISKEIMQELENDKIKAKIEAEIEKKAMEIVKK